MGEGRLLRFSFIVIYFSFTLHLIIVLFSNFSFHFGGVRCYI